MLTKTVTTSLVNVRCCDGVIRHPRPFTSWDAAERFAEWGHCCLSRRHHEFENQGYTAWLSVNDPMWDEGGVDCPSLATMTDLRLVVRVPTFDNRDVITGAWHDPAPPSQQYGYRLTLWCEVRRRETTRRFIYWLCELVNPQPF